MYVLVTWGDAFCKTESVTRPEAMDLKPYITHSVGHLVSNTPEGVTIAVDTWPSEPESFHAYHFVPKNMVIAVVELSVPVPCQSVPE